MIQSSSLVLKTSDISTTKNAETASSSAGSWSNFKQSQQFRVDMRTAIGSDYDKYTRFVLRLNSVSWTACDPCLTLQDAQVVLQLSGLNWVNSSYSCATRSNIPRYDATVINITANTAKSLYFTQSVSLCQFVKGSDQATIQLDLIRTIDGTPASHSSDSYPHFVLMFDIIGIE